MARQRTPTERWVRRFGTVLSTVYFGAIIERYQGDWKTILAFCFLGWLVIIFFELFFVTILDR